MEPESLKERLLKKFEESTKSENCNVVEAFKSILTKKNFLELVKILEVFFGGKESEMISTIRETIEMNLDLFLEEISKVCDHIIIVLFWRTEPTYFFENINWFYIFFVYITIKKMVFEGKIDLPNFREDIQVKFCEELSNPNKLEFYLLMMNITSSPSGILKGVGGLPDCVRSMY
jgi:hypothetical protein